MGSDYLVGIDLGTSNCAIAFVEPARGEQAPVMDFPISQLQRPGEVVSGRVLPSSIYLPGEHELAADLTRLPWGEQPDFVVGEFARWQGARVPGRLVSSAKSWLCHPGVDRTAPILPWGASGDLKKLSPVEASARLLEHLTRAWNFAHPEALLSEQEVILTVPASFDEAARALTVSAAKRAGLDKFTLVEEPQAAFYDFTARHRRDLAQALSGIRLVLVVDVGGGTSDFTLVQVAASPEGPMLRRIAVGEHLMLGGDNMDAALGRNVEERMLSGGKRLNSAQWNQLLQVSRVAKETLLSNESTAHGEAGNNERLSKYHLSIVSESSRLIGGTLSTHITRSEAEQVILEGFFPRCGSEEGRRQGPRAALHEFGLPYAQEPAITRHLAAFLRAHAAAAWAALGEASGSKSELPRPDALLLNGGVFNSPSISERLRDVVSGWWPDANPIPFLNHDSLELAVARGAAFYGLVRRGLGQRIGGGAAHALYVGLNQAGGEDPLALCVIPRGQEEGETVEISGRTFELALGKPVRFPIYSTSSDRFDRSGAVVPITEDMRPLPAIHTVLRGSSGKTGDVPVHLRATLTEIGTLEVSCVANQSAERWRLEFEVRGATSTEQMTVTESMPASFAEARQWIEHCFGSKPRSTPALLKATPPKDVKQLWNSLEKTLGPREEWRLPVLRELWSTLFAAASKRRRSSEHERIYFQLLGFSLRPGFGYALDEWRCEQSARVFSESVQFHKDKANWKEFWILWRRVAGGLSAAKQLEIWDYLRPHLAQRMGRAAAKQTPKPKGVQPEDLDEMVRLAVALEHLGANEKAQLGDWLASRLRDSSPTGGPWAWGLGRLAARVPIYGGIDNTLPPEKVAEWVRLLLGPKERLVEGALFALAQMARLTGDRTRDLDEALRSEVCQALIAAKAPLSWERMVSEVVLLDAADKARALGDTLPVGLVLA